MRKAKGQVCREAARLPKGCPHGHGRCCTFVLHPSAFVMSHGCRQNQLLQMKLLVTHETWRGRGGIQIVLLISHILSPICIIIETERSAFIPVCTQSSE